MIKFDINTFDHNKNYVIEASAGTGKTYNIVQIVNKLVNTYHKTLDKILIVTYTEKAAGELKSRIRDNLKNVNVDNAPIYTIHSFCQNTIKEFAKSANLPLKLNVIDESALNEFAERYIRCENILNDISMFLNDEKGVNIDTLKETLIKATNKYYLDFNGNEDKRIVSLNVTTEQIQTFNLLKEIHKANKFEDLFATINDLSFYYNILKTSSDEKSNNFALLIKNKYKEGFNFSEKTYQLSKKWPKSDEEINAYNFFKNIKHTIKDTKAVPLFVGLYLKDFYLKWQQEKELNKNQSFDDMIRYVREAILRDDKLKNKLQEKYDIAIIDEFQDTNQKQFDIFKSIFMEDDKHKIIVVGDPKQSIYSFQGADVNVYHNAVNDIVNNGGIKASLNKNFRSTANIVDACNKLFSYYDFAGTNFEACDALSVKNNDEKEHLVKYNDEEVKPFWIATSKDKGSIDKTSFADIAVQQILDCTTYINNKTKLQVKDKDDKTYRNVTFKDFTVLARTSSEMVQIERALKNAGIPYLRYKDNKLFLGKECSHWICLLEAINTTDFTGKNRKAFKKALFTSFFGYSLKEIESEYFDKDDIKEIILFNNWKQMALARKWEDLFDDIIMNSNLSINLKSLKELQSLSIFKQISNYCIDYLSNGKSLLDLTRNLSSMSNGAKTEGDDISGAIVEKSTNFDCVQIMTIHASKGLQFSVVIGVCGFKKPITGGKVYTYHDDKQRQILTFNRNDEVVFEETSEWKRLFYVAFTRAQFITILPYYDTYGNEFLKKSIESLISNNKDVIRFIENDNSSYAALRKKTSDILNKTTLASDTSSKEKQDEALKDLISSCRHKKTHKYSYSSLSHGSIIHIDDEENKEGIIEEGLSSFDTNNKVVSAAYDINKSAIAMPANYPKGAKLGTAIHEVFETTDFTNYENVIENNIKHCFLNQGVIAKEEWVIATKEIFINVINATIPIINGANVTNQSIKLNSISLKNRKDEMEFNFNVLNDKLKNYCNGFVDLVFKNGEYYSIVDWKSDTLNDDFESYSDINQLKKHVDDCYSIQRVLYSYCLIKWIKLHKPSLSEQEIFERHFGGVYYIFVRGCNANTGNGIYCQTWDNYETLKQSFDEIVNKKIGGKK